MATTEHFEPLLLENYVRIVALTPDLRTVPFMSVTEVPYHSSTTELLSLLLLIKGSYLSFKVYYYTRKSSLALLAAVARKFM
jgi:hypothetical protein